MKAERELPPCCVDSSHAEYEGTLRVLPTDIPNGARIVVSVAFPLETTSREPTMGSDSLLAGPH